MSQPTTADTTVILYSRTGLILHAGTILDDGNGRLVVIYAHYALAPMEAAQRAGAALPHGPCGWH